MYMSVCVGPRLCCVSKKIRCMQFVNNYFLSNKLYFLRLYSTTRTLKTHVHSYKNTYTNSALMSTFFSMVWKTTANPIVVTENSKPWCEIEEAGERQPGDPNGLIIQNPTFQRNPGHPSRSYGIIYHARVQTPLYSWISTSPTSQSSRPKYTGP